MHAVCYDDVNDFFFFERRGGRRLVAPRAPDNVNARSRVYIVVVTGLNTEFDQNYFSLKGIYYILCNFVDFFPFFFKSKS